MLRALDMQLFCLTSLFNVGWQQYLMSGCSGGSMMPGAASNQLLYLGWNNMEFFLAGGQLTSSLVVQNLWKESWHFAHSVYMSFVDMTKAYECIPGGDIAEILVIRAVSQLWAIELCLHSWHKIKHVCSWCWTPPRLPLVSDPVIHTTRVRTVFRLGTLKFQIFFFWMTWLCWIHQSVTFGWL